MTPFVGLIIVLYIAAGAVTLSVAYLHWRSHENQPGTKEFVLMLVSFTVWSGGLAGIFSSSDLAEKTFWMTVRNFGMYCVPMLWLLFTLNYSGTMIVRWRNWQFWVIAGSALPWLLLDITNSTHGLLYRDFRIEPVVGMLVFSPGPLYLLCVLYAQVLITGGMFLAMRSLMRSSSYFRRHVLLIVSSSSLGMVANLLFTFGVLFVDFSPIIIAALVLPFRNIVVGITPIARPQVVAVMRDGVLIISHSGIVMNMNAAAERMLGLREKQARGVPVQRLIDAFPAQVVQTVPHSSRQMLHFSVAGERLTAEMQIMPIRRRAEAVSGWIVHLRDITAAERARENAIILALEQRRLEILSGFISGAAHEFRTPLTIIRTCAFIAGRATSAEQRAAQHRRIGEQVLRMNRLLDQMRTMMRLDSGSGLSRQPVMLNMLVQREVAQHSGVLSGHPITLALEPMLPAMQGDPDLIACALRELVLNAAQYSPQGSPIEVATVRRQDGAVQLTVTDHGSGLSPEVRGRMFERMYRGDPARSTPGFGLGLSIVRSVAEAHGGCVEVDVTPGMGTSMHLVFAQEPLLMAIPQRVAAEPMVLLQ